MAVKIALFLCFSIASQKFFSIFFVFSPGFSGFYSGPSTLFLGAPMSHSRRFRGCFSAEVSVLRKVSHLFAEGVTLKNTPSANYPHTFRIHSRLQVPVAHFRRGRSPLFLHKVEFQGGDLVRKTPSHAFWRPRCHHFSSTLRVLV